MIGSNDFNFSFSGLKTSLRYFLESGFKPDDLSDICASFQEAVVDVLVGQAHSGGPSNLDVLCSDSGGVSANARLRERVAQMCRESGLRSRTAPPELCTDNALMIAFAASHPNCSAEFR